MIAFDSLHSVRAIAWAVLIALVAGQTAYADEPPLPKLDDIHPAGIEGRLLLCGPEAQVAEIVAALGDGPPAGTLHLITIGTFGPATLTLDHLRPLAPQGTYDFAPDWPAAQFPEHSPKPDQPRAVAWVHADAVPPRTGPALALFRRFAESVWHAGDTLILSGQAAAVVAEQMRVNEQNQPRLIAGSGALTGIVWSPDNTAADSDDATALAAPGRLQLQLDPRGLLWLEGRTLRVPKTSAAAATVRLPPGASGRPDTLRIDREHPADLTILRRAAILRSTNVLEPTASKALDVPSGTLLIVGGGATQDDIMGRFVELAGSSRSKIVVVPTANEQLQIDDHADARRFREAGAGTVTILHSHDRRVTRIPEFLAPLKEATGVWFPGGRQWRLVDAYEGTPFVELCQQVLARDGVIGGTSAGASIQGELLVRGHPLGNAVMLAEGYEQGFAFLPGAAIDQHFSQRRREVDLEAVKRQHPQFTCLGVDESTALLVRGSVGEVLGRGTVSIYDQPAEIDPEQSTERTVVNTGARYDFNARKIVHRTTE
jgi:cyanophycinase